MSDECFRYGISSGCDLDCPVLLDGKCENIAELYEDTRFSKEEIEEVLIPIYRINQYMENV